MTPRLTDALRRALRMLAAKPADAWTRLPGDGIGSLTMYALSRHGLIETRRAYPFPGAFHWHAQARLTDAGRALAAATKTTAARAAEGQ